MRLRRRTPRDVKASITEAVRVRDEATARLAAARDMLIMQRERGRAERATVIAAIRRMREANNLSGMILDAVERETREADDSGAAGCRPD